MTDNIFHYDKYYHFHSSLLLLYLIVTCPPKDNDMMKLIFLGFLLAFPTNTKSGKHKPLFNNYDCNIPSTRYKSHNFWISDHSNVYCTVI